MQATKNKCVKIGNLLKNINSKNQLSKDIQNHLDNCLKCLIVFSRDLNLQKRLKQVVKSEKVPKHLESSIKSFIKQGRKSFTNNRMRGVQ